MKEFKKLPKLKKGDKVAILSPSFAAPGAWPHMNELGQTRLREVFGLEPVEFPTTRKIGATGQERSEDLTAAFSNPEIKAIISSLGGDDQVTYVKDLPSIPFTENPKPFFGFSDNSHFCNFLFLNGVTSFYGGALLTQFAMQSEMDEFTVKYLKHALFEEGELELTASETYNDQGLSWNDESTINTPREHWQNEGWIWSQAQQSTEGILWGGCVESVDEMLRHNTPIPSLKEFEDIVLMLETSEELPSADYVFRVLRALGERGVLARVKGVLVGRAKAWEFDKPNTLIQRENYREDQISAFKKTLQIYNPTIPLVQNLNFGHTDPQIPMPYGGKVRIDSEEKKIFAIF
jgi:muramoyltetrapeptide carboxypeptidase LdcA involved in peptidoglycan recycling